MWVTTHASMQLFIQPDCYGYTGMGKASHTNSELTVEYLLRMSGYVRHLHAPEAYLTTVTFFAWYSILTSYTIIRRVT